jgi:hypothetical protein
MICIHAETVIINNTDNGAICSEPEKEEQKDTDNETENKED